MLLPININDLLGAKTVESNRIEFKEGWNPDAIYRSICAFANDFDNSGGGYIVIGVAEEQGRAKRPVKGLSTEQIARIQQEMIGYNNQIKLPYHPRLFIEEIDGQQIIILWVLGSASRPHEVPENVGANQKIYRYYIRQYANSVRANAEQQQELIAMTNQVPFDDRPNTQAAMADISLLWIREYLRISGSRLTLQAGSSDAADLLEQMGLLSGPPEHRFPRNVALMLFCETPEKFFPYTYIELIHFRGNPGDRDFNETRFAGPVQYQIRQLLDYLKGNILTEKVIKHPDRAEATRLFNYPLAALEEAIANCIYHRDYTVREPVKVFIEADHIRLQNSGGPDRSIRSEDFLTGRVRPKRYRNRRLGDFMKGLDLTEGHATGIRLILDTMAFNGSPAPIFNFDEERSFFEVELPIHPEFLKETKKTILPGLKILGPTTGEPISADQLMKVFEEVFGLMPKELRKQQREEAKLIISDLPPQSIRLLMVLNEHKSMNRKQLLESIAVTNQTRNVERFMEPLLQLKAIERTVKNRTQSPIQAYRLTELGKRLVERLTDLSSDN